MVIVGIVFVGMHVTVGVAVSVAVLVGVSVGTGVSVGVSVAVSVEVGVSVGDCVLVAVAVGGTGVSVGVRVSLGVLVGGTGVSVSVAVAVAVSLGVSVGTAVLVGVLVLVAVLVDVAVGVAVVVAVADGTDAGQSTCTTVPVSGWPGSPWPPDWACARPASSSESVFTSTISTISPKIVLPDVLIVLETITAMYRGMSSGGSELSPGVLVQVPPHAGGVVLSVAAKPLKAEGAGPPERLFSFDHCALQKVTVGGGVRFKAAATVRSPTTKEPYCR